MAALLLRWGGLQQPVDAVWSYKLIHGGSYSETTVNKPIDNGPLGPIFQTSLVTALIGFGIYFDRAASAIPPGAGDAASSQVNQARVAYMQPEALSRHAPSLRQPDQAQGRDLKASCAQPSREPATEDPS